MPTATRQNTIGARRLAASIVVIGGSAAILVACGGSDEALEISDPWARTSPMSATSGAIYMDVTASDDDRLVAASVPADVAGTVEIHETVMRSETGSGEMADGEMADGEMADGEGEMEGHGEEAMTMREMADGLVLPAGETVTLEPGGYHVMLLDLPDPLEIGETFDLTLELESGESRVVSVEVRDEAP